MVLYSLEHSWEHQSNCFRESDLVKSVLNIFLRGLPTMSVKKGINRIAQVIKWISRVFGGLLLTAKTYSMIAERNHLGRNLPSGYELEINRDALVMLFSIVFLMAVAEGIAWVLEGFAGD